MKKFFKFFIFIFLLTNFCWAQSYWIQSAGSSAADEGTDISIDANGNTYSTGYFSGTALFATGISLTSSGVTDIFIEKINNLGVVQWAVKAGGIGPDRGLSIKTDAAGNSFITGYFYGTATFGSTNITASGSSQDIFIAKYDNSGTLVWVTSAGGISGDIGNGINIDGSGNVFITGQFIGTSTFGSFSLTSMTDPTTSSPSIDIFTAKLNSSAVFQWAKKGSAPYTDRGLDVATDNSGNVFVTGQFSDSITFDVVHYNNSNNAIFLIKYDENGNEDWFRKISGTQSIAYGITVDSLTNIFLTGDFQGNLIFWGTPNFTMTNGYTNGIFIAKYNSMADLIWATSAGSSSEVSSRNIALDDSSNAYIVGNFRCKLSSFADQYGQGTFNSVGYTDIFTAKYNSAGDWQWARNFGGHHEDNGVGITLNNSGQVLLTGSFTDSIVFPISKNFSGLDSSIGHYFQIMPASDYGFCGDSSYNKFYGRPSYGNSDIFVVDAIDLSRQPLDYYKRTGSGCNKDFVGVCMNSNPNYYDPCITDNTCADDSIQECGSTFLYANSNTSSRYCDYPYFANFGAIPRFNYLWSTGETDQFIYVKNSGSYTVTMTTPDGCFTSTDTKYLTLHPEPPAPFISDSKGVCSNCDVNYYIGFCGPDSVILTGGNTGGNKYIWQRILPTSPEWSDTSLSIIVKNFGVYSFIIIDSFGCENNNVVTVDVQSLPSMNLILKNDAPDTLCFGEYFHDGIFDSIPNKDCVDFTSISYSSVPPMLHGALPDCGTTHKFYPPVSGTYIISAYWENTNLCGTDSVSLSDTVSVVVIPKPYVFVSGNFLLCPGGNTVLMASGDTAGLIYRWDGPGILSDTTQRSVIVNKPGQYNVYATGTFGCYSYAFNFVTVKPSPVISMSPSSGLVCPNDSVALSVNISGNYQWYGPSGKLGNSDIETVKTAGFYYCIVTDTGNCVMTSNTVEVKNYSTPSLIAVPGTVLCPGDSIIIKCFSNPESMIQWQSPLVGNDSIQVIKSAGTYSCLITSCEITTNPSITVTDSKVAALITPDGPLDFCPTDSVILSANDGMANYKWSNNLSSQNITVNQNGIFTVTTTDSNGCSATSSPVTVIVHAIPPPVINDTTICFGTSVNLFIAAIDTIEWFDVASASIPFFIGNNFTTPVLLDTTSYFIDAKDAVCRSLKNEVTVNVNPPLFPPSNGSNSPICEGDTLFLFSTDAQNAIYFWEGPDSFYSNLSNSFIVNANQINSGIYLFYIVANGCRSKSDSVMVSVLSNPTVNFGNDTIICIGETIVLNAEQDNATYLWQDNSIHPVYQVTDSGIYFVKVNKLGCEKSDTIAIELLECSVWIPNIFTPNGDSHNDYFYIIQKGMKEIKCTIYNRWGELIFQWNDVNGYWDGTIQHSEKNTSAGVYYYNAEIINAKNETEFFKGFIHLIR